MRRLGALVLSCILVLAAGLGVPYVLRKPADDPALHAKAIVLFVEEQRIIRLQKLILDPTPSNVAITRELLELPISIETPISPTELIDWYQRLKRGQDKWEKEFRRYVSECETVGRGHLPREQFGPITPDPVPSEAEAIDLLRNRGRPISKQ